MTGAIAIGAAGAGPTAGTAPDVDFEALGREFFARSAGQIGHPAALVAFARARGLTQNTVDGLRDHLQKRFRRPLARVRVAAEARSHPAPPEASRAARSLTEQPYQLGTRDRSHPGVVKMPLGTPDDGSNFISVRVLNPHLVEVSSRLAQAQSYTWPAAEGAITQALSAFGKATSVQWLQPVNNWLWRHSMPGDHLIVRLDGHKAYVIDKDGGRRPLPGAGT